jgi:hypothetical protein
LESEIVLDGAVRSAFRVAAAALVLGTWMLAGHDAARAQGRLDARYAVTLAGIPIGKGAWVVDITDSQFTAAASGSTAGLLRVFSSGHGTGASRGGVVGGKLVPSAFAASITSDKKTEDVRMALAAGDVKEYEINPMPPPPEPERIPLTEAHRRGANDPMTSLLVRVPGNGNPVGPRACERIAAVFDGRLRYNLQFAYKRMEHVKADKGYEGPAVVCSIFFTPVAGHIPTRSAIKYLEDQRDMEVWLAPIASTRTLVPFRVSIPTPVGTGTLQATQFISVPPQRAAVSATVQ